MSTETYYAIRIGDPKRHHPYLMLGPDRKTPALFVDRKSAEAEKEFNSSAVCVVRVKIVYGK